jgi:hypothetical protein
LASATGVIRYRIAKEFVTPMLAVPFAQAQQAEQRAATLAM